MAQDTLQLEAERISGGKARTRARLPNGDTVHLDTVDLASALARQRFAKAVYEKIPTADPNAIENELLRVADSMAQSPSPATTVDLSSAAASALQKMPADIRDEAEAMLSDRLLIQRIVDDIAALEVAGEKELSATVYLIGVSRLLDHPLAGIVQGPSSSGKSYLIEKTASLFPPETVIHATQMTPQALFHMRPGSLCHRFIVGGERSRLEEDERAEATRALREMISAGKLTKLMPMKVEGGKIETVSIEQDGPIAYVESTTMAKVFDEDANRCIMMNTDERPEQTRRIVRQLAAAYTGASGTGSSDRIVLRHHALQRMLQATAVVVPYAEQVGELIPSDRVEVRRAFPHLIGMVQAVTLLHERQRERNANGALVATEEDYQIARHLLSKPMARLLGSGVSDPARRFLQRLTAWAKGEFTATAAKLRETSSKSAVHGWLSELHESGLVEQVQAGRGRTPACWRLTDTAHDADTGILPTLQDVFPESTWTHGRKAQMA